MLLTDLHSNLACEHDSVSPALKKVPQQLLRITLDVYVRRVKKVDPSVEGTLQNPQTFILGCLRSECHRSKTRSGDIEIRALQCASIHLIPLLFAEDFELSIVNGTIAARASTGLRRLL